MAKEQVITVPIAKSGCDCGSDGGCGCSGRDQEPSTR